MEDDDFWQDELLCDETPCSNTDDDTGGSP